MLPVTRRSIGALEIEVIHRRSIEGCYPSFAHLTRPSELPPAGECHFRVRSVCPGSCPPRPRTHRRPHGCPRVARANLPLPLREVSLAKRPIGDPNVCAGVAPVTHRTSMTSPEPLVWSGPTRGPEPYVGSRHRFRPGEKTVPFTSVLVKGYFSTHRVIPELFRQSTEIGDLFTGDAQRCPQVVHRHSRVRVDASAGGTVDWKAMNALSASAAVAIIIIR